jgi:secondary thiamine-phosphate synthase enzyme
VTASGVLNGLTPIFAPQATDMLILTENILALLDDIKQFLEALVSTLGNYNHPINAHAHLRSVLFAPNQTLPIIDGRVELGTWQ